MYQHVLNTVREVKTYGGFTGLSGLIHMHALSAVLKLPIEFYYPLSSYHFSGIQCFNTVDYGRGVRHKAPVAIIMWSKAIFNKKIQLPQIILFRQLKVKRT